MHVHAHDHDHVDGGSPLGFTGERVLPDDPKWAWCFQAHLFGYNDLAARAPADAVMLDIGCGEGYGTAVLSQRAAHLVTGDVSEETVRHARDRYRKDNVSFIVFDAQRLPFRDAAFDVTSSLQVIEHFSDTQAHLADVAQVTKRGGLHYVTTPNIDQMGEAERDNPYHLRDFNTADFRSSLEQHFSQVEVLGMFYVEASPRYQAMVAAEAKEDALRPKLERLERRLSALPGALRARLRPIMRRLSGVKAWPLPEAEQARNTIVAEDFYAGAPPEGSFCLIGIATR